MNSDKFKRVNDKGTCLIPRDLFIKITSYLYKINQFYYEKDYNKPEYSKPMLTLHESWIHMYPPGIDTKVYKMFYTSEDDSPQP